MRLLVSCPRRLLLVDASSREVGVVESERPEYYGISWTPDGKELALSHSLIDNFSVQTLEDNIESDRGYLRLGGRRGVDSLSLPHQIHCTAEHVLIANTGRNCLTVARRDDLFYRHVWVDDVRWDRKGKSALPLGMHLNSVHLRGDRLLLLAHNFDRGSEIVELSWPGLDLVGRLPTRAYQAHNVWPLPGGEILTCDSLRGSVIEATSGRTFWKATESGSMTRGLACAGGLVFVGMSKFAGRKGRTETDGGIWILDRESGREIDFLPLSSVGNIHEIRVIDEPDECHHGFPLASIPAPAEELTEEYRRLVERRAIRDQPAPCTPGAVALWTERVGEVSVEGRVVTGAWEGDLTLATCDTAPAMDVAVSARLRVQPNSEERHLGLVARYTGPGDQNMLCGMLEMSPFAIHASIWRNARGQWERLVKVPLVRVPDLLRFVVQGTVLELWGDGERLLRVEDIVHLQEGYAGVRCLTGSYLDFQVHAPTPDTQSEQQFLTVAAAQNNPVSACMSLLKRLGNWGFRDRVPGFSELNGSY